MLAKKQTLLSIATLFIRTLDTFTLASTHQDQWERFVIFLIKHTDVLRCFYLPSLIQQVVTKLKLKELIIGNIFFSRNIFSSSAVPLYCHKTHKIHFPTVFGSYNLGIYITLYNGVIMDKIISRNQYNKNIFNRIFNLALVRSFSKWLFSESDCLLK